MKNLSFNDLVLGKLYKAVPSGAWRETTKKAIYADIQANDPYIGLIHPTQTFVLLDKFDEKYHPATKILSVDGVVGWVWWSPTTVFKQATNEE